MGHAIKYGILLKMYFEECLVSIWRCHNKLHEKIRWSQGCEVL